MASTKEYLDFPVAVKLMPDAERELPYEGAKEMLLVDNIDNREFVCKLVQRMWEELPERICVTRKSWMNLPWRDRRTTGEKRKRYSCVGSCCGMM